MPPSPPPSYVDNNLDVPHLDGYDYVDIDFDKPVVSVSSPGTGLDLEYTFHSGLRPASKAKIGTGPAERPNDPKSVSKSAETRPVNLTEPEEAIETGMAFCVITDKGNIIWFTVTDKSQDTYSPGFTFRATMWSR